MFGRHVSPVVVHQVIAQGAELRSENKNVYGDVLQAALRSWNFVSRWDL